MEDKKFLEQSEDLLKEKKEKLQGEIDQLKEQDPLGPESGGEGISEYSESADASEEHERIQEEIELLQKQLKEVNLALSKIPEGKYGICENCGQPIDKARLKAYPHARYCITCEKRLSQS